MWEREIFTGYKTLMNLSIDGIQIFTCRVEIFIFLAETVAFCQNLATKTGEKNATKSATNLERLTEVMKVSISPTKRYNSFL